MPKTDTPTQEPPAEAPADGTLGQVLSLLQDLTARQERLEADLRETKARAPAFKPMAAPVQREMKGIFAGMNPAPNRPVQREGISKQILVDERGDKLPSIILNQYPPEFGAGDACRVNPASRREGWPEGLTWADVLAKQKCEGVGVIRKVYWLRDTGEWKYSAHIRGLTNGRPDGFLSSELLPA